MLSKNYNWQVIVPTESNCRANTFPKYNTHSAGVQLSTLMYGPSVRFVQAVLTITHFMTGAYCAVQAIFNQEPIFKKSLKTAYVKYNQLNIGLRFIRQTCMIFTFDLQFLHPLFCRASCRTAALQPLAACSNTLQRGACLRSHRSEHSHFIGRRL